MWEDISIHSDLAQASTLPSSFYLDPDFYEREKEKIFGSSWQIAGRAEQVAKAGDFIALEIAGEPVIIVRGNDHKLRAFSNVCRHRGSLILEGGGCTKALKCPYHSWTYDLNGELQHAPEFDGVQNWNRSDVRLPEFQAKVFGPLLFVNLGKQPLPFTDVIGSIPAEITARLSAEQLPIPDANGIHHQLQLEGVCRQLPGRLSPTLRASGINAGTRL
jgi:choline monooxygenase